MADQYIITILPILPKINTVLVAPLAIKTVLEIKQGAAGPNGEQANIVSDPVAYYILAKS